MRVLFSSTSGVGHVLPMVPLARAFRAAGHEVLWAAADVVQPMLAELGIPGVATGPTGSRLADLRGSVLGPAATVPPAHRAAFVFPRMFGEGFAPPMAADLLPTARGWRPDLLVHENGELASPLVGAVLGIPCLTHAFGGPVPAGHLDEAGERLAPMWADHGLEVPPYAGCFESGYLDICPGSVRSESRSHIRDVQSLRPASPAPAGRQEPPLVYVTMGTVQNRVLDLGPIVKALAGLPVEVLVAVGTDGDLHLVDQPGNVRVEHWVDQSRVLEVCSAVVSHGGSGTFLGALAAGVPQLCLPQAADQFRNAEGGRRAGAALVLTPDEISPAAVLSAVRRLLDDHDIREGAHRVAAEIAAMPAPEDVVTVLAQRYGGSPTSGQ